MRIESRAARELLAVGIFGNQSRLGGRIAMLLRQGRTFSPRPSAPGVAASAVALGALLLAGSLAPRWIAFAQEAPVRMQFEVASVKLNQTPKAGSIRQIHPGSLFYTNRALAEYIQVAYSVQPYQVVHSPAISLAGRYDVEAKAAKPVPEAQVRLMLQSLLADRFRLMVHTENREISAFVLTVAKGGPRFKPSADEGPMGAFLKDGAFHYRRTTVGYLAGSVLSNLPSLGRPVVDRTGLDGIYDFSLKLFDPDAGRAESDPKGDTLRQLDNGLNASLKELGLKLEAQKTPVEFLVVDHVEKPDAN